MMTALDRSPWLHAELNDGGLRQIINRIVSASDKVVGRGHGSQITLQEQELERAKEVYPNFATFIDKLLVLAGVLERQSSTISESMMELPLGEWLAQHVDPEELQQGLALKPIPRPVAMFEPIPRNKEESEEASSSSSSSSEASSLEASKDRSRQKTSSSESSSDDDSDDSDN